MTGAMVNAAAAQATSAGVAAADAEASPGGERQVPFFCPYCGEEELRPAGAKPGRWDCRSCARGFELKFTGVLSADPLP